MQVWPRPRPLPGLLIGGTGLVAAATAFAGATGSLVLFLLMFALAIAVATLVDWKIGVPLLLVVAVTDGFLKHLTSSTATYILKDALLAIILVGLFVRLALQRSERPDGVRWRGAIAWAVYVGFMITQIAHPAGSIAGALGAFRAHAAFALLFIVGALYFQDRERLSRTANLTIALCTFCAVGALAQHALGDRWMTLSPGFLKASLHYAIFPGTAAQTADIGAVVYRMYGTLVDPAALGLACAYGILFAFASLARMHGAARIFTIIAIPVMGMALALTQARAAMGGLALGLVLLAVLLFTRRATRGYVLVGMMLIAVAVPAGILLTHGSVVDHLLSKHQVAYAQATRDLSQTLVLSNLSRSPFGHGLGATGAGGGLRDEDGLSVDNVYFANLYETGVLGLCAFLAVQLTLFVLGIRATLRARDVGAQTVFAGIVAAQAALLAASWFAQGAFDYAPMAQFFWLFAGAVARSDRWA
jgi:hypothetical protein